MRSICWNEIAIHDHLADLALIHSRFGAATLKAVLGANLKCRVFYISSKLARIVCEAVNECFNDAIRRVAGMFEKLKPRHIKAILSTTLRGWVGRHGIYVSTNYLPDVGRLHWV